MKKLSLLRDWTKVLFVLAVLPIIFIPPIVLLLLFAPQVVPDMKLTYFDELNWGSAIAMFIILIGYSCFVYALFLFRKVLSLFSKNCIFDNEVINYFYKIGQMIYYGLILTEVPAPIYRIATQKPININVDTAVISITIAVISLGLFFTVLGEIFKKAKQLKEENDLTV